MADLFQILGVPRDADFIAIRDTKNLRIQDIRKTVNGAEQDKEIDKVMHAWRILGCWGSRERYLRQLQQESTLDTARRQQDAQFEEEAAQHSSGSTPEPATPPTPATPISPLIISPIATPIATPTPTPMPTQPIPTPTATYPRDPMDWYEPQEEGQRPPAQWFKQVAQRALTTICSLREDLNRTYAITDGTRRRLILELRHMPKNFVQGVTLDFTFIIEGYDVLMLKMLELADYCRPAAAPRVRDDWDHRRGILARLPVARDLVFRFSGYACALDFVVEELVGETGNDRAREDELLDDLGVILDQWRQLINTFQGGNGRCYR
ncbi:hypothetical protein PG996_000157 [Apiospora saccharicola]|uniref:Uncharacterized protein n=1 Tax=Apiospora saccharicola TaxID=335842 RepID=A0ABR1WCY4_9PEZI